LGGGAVAPEAAVAAVADQLVDLLQRKVFLREVATAGLVELLQHRSQSELIVVFDRVKGLTNMLTCDAATAAPEGLLLALRLWHNMPQAVAARCVLLPAASGQTAVVKVKPGVKAGVQPPPVELWLQPQQVPREAVAAAAAALFSPEHMKVLQPVLLKSVTSAPRLHQVWSCLLVLLLPGFTPVKVRAQSQGWGGRFKVLVFFWFWAFCVEFE
jgi:hypothetical protein